jgi:CBS domain-containing protein
MSESELAWTVGDVMSEDVLTVSPGVPFKELVAQVLLAGVSGLPVVTGGRLVGMVTESDLMFKEEQGTGSSVLQWTRHLAELAAGQDSPALELTRAELSRALGRTAGDLMTTPAITIGPRAGLDEAARLMRRHGVKRLAVVDGRGRLAGVVSRADLLKVFLRTDDALERAARAALGAVLTEPDVVTVSVREGVVTLAGAVNADPEAEAAVTRVEALPGVVGVENRLRSDL